MTWSKVQNVLDSMILYLAGKARPGVETLASCMYTEH